MPSHSFSQTIEAHGCSIQLRRLDGPLVSELHFHCQPPATTTDAAPQAEAIYQAILDVLGRAGGGYASVVTETIFLRQLAQTLEPVRDARERVLCASQATTHRPATTEIEQPPLNAAAWLEVLVQAVLPRGASPHLQQVACDVDCDCPECARVSGLRVDIGGDTRLHAGNLVGAGDDAYAQTLAMFHVAEKLLQRAGMDFRDVVRTWIYLGDIDRDYPLLNRARREFFRARNVVGVPASTGIAGVPASARHDLCMSIYALKAQQPLQRVVMTSPTLNEAPQYGADFVRGLKVVDANKTALHVSGTASIDATGATAHRGDLAAQADRMLVNVAALLDGQGADFSDIVSAITYLRHVEDAAILRDRFRAAGFDGFPNVLVAAPICRADLLCETEVLAMLPASTATR